MARRFALFLLVLVITPIVFLVGPAASAQEQTVSKGQKLAYLTKPAVVRIWDGYVGEWTLANGSKITTQYVGSGSGSIINPDGYILTNAHVTELTHNGDDKGKEILFEQLVRILAQKAGVNPDQAVQDREVLQSVSDNSSLTSFTHIHHVVLPSGDAFPFEIKEFGAPVGQGKDVSVVKIEVKNAPTLKIGDSEKVQLQDTVTVIGYPAAADTFDSGLLDSKSQLEASITDGKVSAKKNTSDGAPILQISAPATHGNSGGPVLNENSEQIGMLTFRGDTVNGQEVSGFAFVIPSSTALEFVKKAGTTNVQGLTDQRFQEGLDAYLNGYYTQAIAKFEEVRRLFPQHSEVARLITDSQQKISEGKEKSGALPLVIGIAVVLLLGFIIIVGVIIILVRRKKRAPAMGQPAYPGVPAGFGAPQSGIGFPPQPQQPAFPPTPPPQAPMAFQPQPQQAPPPAAPGHGEKTVVIGAVAAGAQPGLGSLACTSGALMGQRFEIRPEGVYIGRDGTLSQIVVNDNRVSKRHVWIGPRNGRITVVDQGSTNGTFLNAPGSQRITESYLNPGDTVIVSEADVARFQFQK